MVSLSRASVSEAEHNKSLLEVVNELLQQPLSSKEELLEKLDKLEHLLSLVKQMPSVSTRDAFRPAMEALVADGLLQHSDMDVKVSVASCISEIMRITAPDQPYNDSLLEDFFELAVLAFGKLSCLDGRFYSKAVSIIEVLAKYRTCVLMLDLMLDALIVQMFQHFLNGIRPDHPDKVFTDIKEIMTMIIEESENIPMQFLSIITNILINSVKKENQNVSPRSYVLGEEVLQESAVKLHPYLPKAVAALNISLNNYSKVVELTRREAMKCKATALGSVSNTKEIDFPKARKKQRKQRKRKYFLSQEEGEATDDPTPSTMTMQHNLTPKGVHENKGVMVDVHGYKVKVSSGPILTAIFSKYGDIAVNCHYKSLTFRASLLDIVCDVVRRLKTGNVGSTSINDMRISLSAAARVKLDVTWLQQYLDEISEEGDMEKRLSDLTEVLGSVSNTKEINFPKACKKQRKERKRRKYLPSQEEGKAADDLAPPPTTKQHNLTPKGVRRNKGVKVDVHGYKVEVSSAPILTAIFAKYGDIAVNCHYKSLASRASLLDLVCDVVKRLKAGDVGSSSIKQMKSFVSTTVGIELDVAWLQQYLDEISKEEDMEKRLHMDIDILLR